MCYDHGPMLNHTWKPHAHRMYEMQPHVYPRAVPALARRYHSRLRKVIAPERNGIGGCDVGVPRFVPREESGKSESCYPQCHIEDPGPGFYHPVSMCEVLERLMQLPRFITERLGERLDHLSMPHLRRPSEPAYGMQWGSSVYLLPIENNLIEILPTVPPTLRQELAKYGAEWIWNEHDKLWECHWSVETLRIFYLEDVLLHEIGHVLDDRNHSPKDREVYANAFAEQYGSPPKRFRGKKPPHAQRKHRRHDRG